MVAVEQEFRDMQRYNETANTCHICNKILGSCEHSQSRLEKLMNLCAQKVRAPLLLAMFCFVITNSNGMTAIRPYFVQIFKVFNVPIDPNWASVKNFNLHNINM